MYMLNAFSLNMIDGDCSVDIKSLSLAEAKKKLVRGIDNDATEHNGRTPKFLGYNLQAMSAVGHADTARVLSSLLGCEVPANRITVSLRAGDVAIVAQYKGPRLEEGATKLPEGATVEFLRVEIGPPAEKIRAQALEHGKKLGAKSALENGVSDEDMLNMFE